MNEVGFMEVTVATFAILNTLYPYVAPVLYTMSQLQPVKNVELQVINLLIT